MEKNEKWRAVRYGKNGCVKSEFCEILKDCNG